MADIISGGNKWIEGYKPIDKIKEEEKALRYNEGKRKWSLIDYPSLEEMVKVLEMGATKYAPFNWQKGLNREELLESAMRHMVALMNKEEVDQESGISHAGHIMCNMLFYIWMHNNDKFIKK